MKKLKAQLEQKTHKNGTENGSSPDSDVLENGTDPNIMELQSKNPRTHISGFPTSFPDTLSIFALALPGDSNRVISDLKFKLVKSEQEATALEQNVSRKTPDRKSQRCDGFTPHVAFCCCWFPGNQA